MRRLVILTILLGYVPVSKAAFLLTVNGEIPPSGRELVLRPGETLDLGIWSMDERWYYQTFEASVFVEGPGSIEGHAFVVPFDPISAYFELEDFAADAQLPPDVVLQAAEEHFAFLENLTDLSVMGLRMRPGDSPSDVQGLFLDGIVLTCHGIGDVELTLVDMNSRICDTLIVRQIPEPAAVLLLGLGGTGLLCKRRQA